MKNARLPLTAAAIGLIAACTAPGGEIEPVPVAAAATETEAPALWNFSASAAGLPALACDEPTSADQGFVPLDLTVTRLDAKDAEAVAGRLPEDAQLAGAWELTSSDPNFGGLSGLAIADPTTLLAATDAGGWVRLSLDAGAPKTASIGYMRGGNGKFLNGKGENDAEGLAMRDGIAFVSFERDFRIEAFALGTCGAASKAVRIAALPGAFDGRPIAENAGPEAMSLTGEGNLRFGFEDVSGGASPLGRVLAAGKGEWMGEFAANPPGYALVSMDSVSLPDGSNREVFLYRAFDPLRGARSVLTWGPDEGDRLALSRPLMTDNFEGLAADVTEAGQLRIWIVSDNNFSAAQRTLIYAFDIAL